MDINVNRLQAFFTPYDFEHLLRLWGVMTCFLLIFALMVIVVGLYPSAKHFWKIQLAILAGSYFISALCFLVFHLNALVIIGVMICQSLIVLGDLGVKEKEGPREDWWESRGLTQTAQLEEQEM
jgi:CDP-diglyceride synthetase